MPDSRHHRGPAPDDPHLFNDSTLPALRAAVADLSLLLTRGYALPGSLKLVGDRYTLTTRQRTAVWRCACPGDALAKRLSTKLPADSIANHPLLIDGYNLLLTLESALGHATLLRARDTCLRDLAAVHGTYRTVHETLPALELLGQTLAALHPAEVTFLLDAPVSNSGRLKQPSKPSPPSTSGTGKSPSTPPPTNSSSPPNPPSPPPTAPSSTAPAPPGSTSPAKSSTANSPPRPSSTSPPNLPLASARQDSDH